MARDSSATVSYRGKYFSQNIQMTEVFIIFQVVSRSQHNQIGALGSLQLQLLMLLYLRPSRPTFSPDRFALSVPGGEAVWYRSHLQH